MKNRGMSLIMLVITIIVMIVLAGTVVMGLVDNNPMDKANEAVFKASLGGYASEVEMTSLQYLVKHAFMPSYTTTVNVYDNKEKLKEFIPSLRGDWEDKLSIEKSKIVFTGKKELEQKWALEIGVAIEGIERYYTEMEEIEKNIKKISTNFPGQDISRNPVDIRGVRYSNGWYKLETKEHFEAIGMDFSKIKYAPYIVRYTDDVVINIAGRMINGVPVHSHNYDEQKDSFYSEALITAVDANSFKSRDKWGDFKIASSSGIADDVTFVNNSLKLTKNSKIAMLEVDQTRPINERYSINITVQGSTAQEGDGRSATALCAISQSAGKFITWLGIYKNHLQVFTFRDKVKYYTAEEVTEEGFASIDISKYNNKPMNVQVTAECGGKSIVYINGKKVKEFNSGKADLVYKTLTLGELRPGRGLKYEGLIHNFSLNSIILKEEQIKQNFEYSKKNTIGL